MVCILYFLYIAVWRSLISSTYNKVRDCILDSPVPLPWFSCCCQFCPILRDVISSLPSCLWMWPFSIFVNFSAVWHCVISYMQISLVFLEDGILIANCSSFSLVELFAIEGILLEGPSGHISFLFGRICLAIFYFHLSVIIRFKV